MISEYDKRYDDNGGFGHWVQGSRRDGEDHVCEVRCYRITSYDVDDGTIESSELLVAGTIYFDGRARFDQVAVCYDDPYEAERVGLAMRRCYEAAKELLAPALDWQWEADPGGWQDANKAAGL